MAERGTDALLAWTTSTFHTTVLVVAAVLALQQSGVLDDLLGGLDTATGFVLFALLWGTTWWTNCRLLAGTPLREAAVRRVLVAGAYWGALTGVAFLGELLFVLVVRAAAEGTLSLPSQPLPLLAIAAVASVAAALVGAAVGTALAAVDAAAIRAVRRLPAQ